MTVNRPEKLKRLISRFKLYRYFQNFPFYRGVRRARRVFLFFSLRSQRSRR
jgi:hypothetical protein